MVSQGTPLPSFCLASSLEDKPLKGYFQYMQSTALHVEKY